jgi:hypothetical protein
MNNDTITLFLATSILAVGGLGLYIFNTNKEQNGYDNDDLTNDNEQEDNNELVNEYVEPIQKQKQVKTKKVRKVQFKGTKRRY